MSASDELLRRLDELSARLRDLEDRESIRNVIAAYGPAVDRGDSAGAARLFAEDGAYDVGGYGVHEGRTAIEALFEGDVHQGLIMNGAAHFLSPVRIDLNGDAATAIGYSAVFTWVDGAFKAHRIAANRWELERISGAWRVKLRVNRLLDGSAEARSLLRQDGAPQA
jgi:uncharacterized protein (TIGR02246 family)